MHVNTYVHTSLAYKLYSFIRSFIHASNDPCIQLVIHLGDTFPTKSTGFIGVFLDWQDKFGTNMFVDDKYAVMHSTKRSLKHSPVELRFPVAPCIVCTCRKRTFPTCPKILREHQNGQETEKRTTCEGLLFQFGTLFHRTFPWGPGHNLASSFALTHGRKSRLRPTVTKAPK